jgi:hypothetical protein
MAIQARRGLKQDFYKNKLLPGELAAPLDTKELYAAFAPGDVKKIATYEDMVSDIEQAQADIIAGLTSGVVQAQNDAEIATETANAAAQNATDKAQLADDAATRANTAAQAAENIVQQEIATNTIPGVVKGGGDVNIEPDGTMSVPELGDASSLETNDKTNAVSAINEIIDRLKEIASDDTFINNHFLSHLASYIGIKNEGYTDDNATRFYIIPKASVTTGVGGTLKIFGDDYFSDSQNYRDLGVYFSANQNGETGYNGQGAFYINVKVFGSYLYTSPDLIFSFQDGADIGGRFVRIVNTEHTDSRAIFVVGEGKPIIALLDAGMVEEIQGSLGLLNNKAIKWLNSSGTSIDAAIYYTNTNRLRFQGLGGLETYINNLLKVIQVENYSRFDHAVVYNTTTTYSGIETTISASGTNMIKLAQSSSTIVNSITGGQNGQELVLYFSNGNTTIKQNNVAGGIALAGGVDFVGTPSDMLTLLYVSDRWIEKCRSIN